MNDPKEDLRDLILGLAEGVDDMLTELGREDTEEEPELAPLFLRMLAAAVDQFPGLAAFLDKRCEPQALA